jgi:outer membrane PBP1 activator LpoA protein
VVEGIVEASKTTAEPPGHVALLLPLSGPYAKVAAAVRDGFLAAWFNDQLNPQRPIVTIYNTGESDVWAVYETAIGAGADFVVGPLAKRSVATLASVNTLPVPTLALNFADPPGGDSAQADPTGNAGATDPAAVPGEDIPGLDDESDTDEVLVQPMRKRLTRGLYQFALSPEGEAHRVAERAWFDGHAQAALIWPEGDWGSRVSNGFVEAWENLGGVVVRSQAYTSDAKDMSAAVQALLGVDQSKDRWRVLRKTINTKVEHQPRRRQDVEFIFMAGFPTQARQIRPQLQFHHASGLPVYSTSHVFGGTSNPAGDIDLNGVVFGDAPWILLYDTDRPGLRTSVEQLWGDSSAGLVRLYAFGADAYAIIPHLGRLRAQESARFPGYTGRLSVGADNRVQRELVWAEFANGVPRLIDIELPPD